MNNINFIIRDISLHDLDTIYLIETSSYNAPWTKINLSDEIIKSNNLNLCIITNSSIIGYCFSYFVNKDLFITNFCIHPDHRNKHFGTILLNNLLDKANQKFIRLVFLEVREKNFAAIKLYKKLGFSQDCIRKNFYSNGDNALLMHLDLA